MKKILNLVTMLLCTAILHAQLPTVQQYETEQAAFWRTALQAIPQSSSSTGKMVNTKILYDKATPFAALFTYNEEDNNLSHYDHFLQSLSEMHRASDKTLFESADALENKAKNYAGTNIVPVGILDVDFIYLNYTPENPSLNALTLQDGVYRPIGNKDAFTQKHISVVSPLAKIVAAAGNRVTYRFSQDYWYRYGDKKIRAMSVDFGTGAAVSVIQNGALVQNDFMVTYSTFNDTKLLTFNITYSDGTQLATYSGIGVSGASASATARGKSALLPFESAIPDPGTGAKGKIEYRIFYGENNADNKLRKPFIIVDGFDPGDKRKIVKLDCENDIKYKCIEKNQDFDQRYESIEYLMKYNNENSDLKTQLIALNYDVIIVNFPNYKNNLGQEVDGGADDIFRNGRTIASFIQKLNADLQANGSAEKLVVVGPSMGGQITRYALAYLEKNNIPTNTRLWLSMDSPHQGASIPLAIQGDLYWMGEILNREPAKKQYRGILQSKAAKQMLLTIAGPGTNFYNQEHNAYVQELKSNGVAGSNGYPMLNGIKKIAIANGSTTGVKNVNPGGKFYEIAAFAKIRFFGIKVDNMPTFRINNWFMPEKNTTGALLQNYSYKPKNTTNWNHTNGLSQGSLDAVPGGSFNAADDLKLAVHNELTGFNAFSFPLQKYWYGIRTWAALWSGKRLKVEQRLPNNINTPIPAQSFIPTHSALDTSGFSDWYQPIDKNLVCSKQTPFDSYYGEAANMPHITFTDNMVNWLLGWLSGSNPSPTFYGTDPNVTISGPSSLCLNQSATYSFSQCGFSGSTQWSATGSATVVSQNSNSVTIQSVSSGKAVITANLTNGQSYTKTIWIGKPKISFRDNTKTEYNRVLISVLGADPGISLQQMGVDVNSIVWKRLDINRTINGGTSHSFRVVPSVSSSVEVQATVSNSCGTETISHVFYPTIAPPCNSYRMAKTQALGDEYAIMRVPPDSRCPGYAIRSSQAIDEDGFDITIANSLGNIVLSQKGNRFNLNNFPTGSYYVKVVKDNQVIASQTLVKH